MATTIEGFQTHLIRRKVSARLATSYGQPDDVKTHVIVSLKDKNGNVGQGEASPLPFFTGETAESIQLILEQELLPKLIGTDVLDIANAHEIMKVLPGNSSAKAAIDMALYDLAAQILQVPEYKLLGGACRSKVPITGPIGITSIEDAVIQARCFVKKGHQTLKMKMGVDPEQDIKRVRAVREAVGSNVAIRIDCNQGYDLPTTFKVLDALSSQGIQYCEQPLPAWDIKGLATLRSQTGIKIAADESLHTVRDAIQLVERQAVDVFIIKLIKTSGLWPALQIASIAQSANLTCVVVSPFDTQIGAAHSLHLAKALPSATMACELSVFASQPEMGETDHRLVSGGIITSDAPGCGVKSIKELKRSKPV